MKKVLITGVLGQDGANMAKYLLDTENVLIYGMMRRTSNVNETNKVFNSVLNFFIRLSHANLPNHPQTKNPRQS